MPRLFRAFTLLLLLFVRSGLPAQTPTLPTTELRPDPSVRYGTLPNGVRYAVMPNAEPKGRASLRVIIDVGSLEETDDQAGIAHFLEHMAFNGSVRYAPGTLVEFFQRMGMTFGGDTNAYTANDHTQYMLELADNTAPTIGEGLRIFADYAGGLLLQTTEIDKERGIILSEKRARDSVSARTSEAHLAFSLDGTRYPMRSPIGSAEVVAHAPRERFVDFYDTWYRPANLIVVAVGDFEPEMVESLIRQHFAPLTDRAPARPRFDRGQIDDRPGLKIGYHPEPEANAVSLSLSTVRRLAGPLPDTAANRLKDLPAEVAHGILSMRIAKLAREEGAPFTGGGAGLGESFDLIREASVGLSTTADRWPAALTVAENELRRALLHGFHDSEVAEVVATIHNGVRQAAKNAASRRSAGLANALGGSLHDQRVFTTPADDLALIEPALNALTAESCAAALRQEWSRDNRRIFLTGNLPMSAAEAEQQVSETFARAQSLPVSAPPSVSRQTWDYTRFGETGVVTSRRQVEDLDLTLVTFANGVRLNLKRTTFDTGRIGVLVKIDGGAKLEPTHKPGLVQIANSTFDAGGLGKYTTEELRRLLAGRNVGVRFGIGFDAIALSGTTTPEDLPLSLQLMAAKITDPGYRSDALRLAQTSIEQLFLGLPHSASGPMSTDVAQLLVGGDSRFGLPPKEKLLAITTDDIRTWLSPQLANGAMEIGIVGDIDIDKTIAAVAATLGSLPPRAAPQSHPELLRVAFPSQPFARSYAFDSAIPKGLVTVYWPTTDGREAPRSRRYNLLAAVLADRLRVKLREEMGGTYSPSANSAASDTIPGYGYFTSSIDVAPEMADRVRDALLAEAASLARDGVNADELERARRPLLTGLRESVRSNGYWLSAVLSRAQSEPQVLDWARTREADIAAITPAELSTLAKTYLTPERASSVIVLPKPAATP